jgi:hypothetical protein
MPSWAWVSWCGVGRGRTHLLEANLPACHPPGGAGVEDEDAADATGRALDRTIDELALPALDLDLAASLEPVHPPVLGVTVYRGGGFLGQASGEREATGASADDDEVKEVIGVDGAHFGGHAELVAC